MIICIKKENIVRAIVITMAVILTVGAFMTLGLASTAAANGNKKLPVYSVECEDKRVALTFDAAWGADKTADIMRILADKDVKATFFLVGFWVDKYPEDVKKLHEQGIEIGNHSHNHLKMSTLSEYNIIDELEYVNKKVEALTGVRPKVFRPPFGDYNDRLVDTVRGQNMIPIQWSVDTLDWKGIRPDEILTRVKARVDKGGIILFHNNSDYVVQALPIVIDYLRAEGYTFSTVSDLVYHEDYYIDSTGRQHKNIKS